MAGPKSSTAFGVALPTAIALNAEGNAPARILLVPLPKDGLIRTFDGRGPYRVRDPKQLCAESLKEARAGLLPIDVNHSTDLAAPHGGESPARGWMTNLLAEPDGIYADVDWTSPGKALLAERSYRAISTAFFHDAAGNVTRIARASLVNNPNLRGMVALNAEEDNNMDLLAKLRQALGLADEADADAVCAKVTELKGGAATQLALQAELGKIAEAAKLKPDAKPADVLAAVKALGTAGEGVAFKALQGELATTTENFNNLQTAIATDKATAFVDGAIREGRVGVKALRDHYIARHAESAAGAKQVETEIGKMPKLSGSTIVSSTVPTVDKDGKPIIALNAEQSQVARLLGIKPDDMKKTLAAEAERKQADA